MKWYQDLLAWFILLLMLAISFIVGFFISRGYLVEHCKTYGAFKISDEEAMLCVVKPLLKNNSGEMNYLRPEGKKPIQVKEI